MRMLDENGRFQFVKNQQVSIDSTLPKYQKLVEVSKKKKHVNGDYDVVETEAYSSSEDDFVTNYGEGTSNVDKTVREQIMSMTNKTLRDYLMSPDANEFNAKFKPILEAEKSANGYSLAIPQNRWMAEGVTVEMDKCYGPRRIWFKRIRKIINAIKDVISTDKNDKIEKEASLNVLDFFDSIHVEVGKEKEFINRIEGYFSMVRNAALMHQDGQLDELCKNIILQIYESVLYVNGYDKYITFSDIENMQSIGKHVVDIDYIRYFGRIIPNDIVNKKVECDNLGVFDNYCVMYYDPTGQTYKAPESARRDPILFGLINHSDKLYYIGDWIDDKCDLTLDKVAELCSISELDSDATTEDKKSEPTCNAKTTKKSKKKKEK